MLSGGFGSGPISIASFIGAIANDGGNFSIRILQYHNNISNTESNAYFEMGTCTMIRNGNNLTIYKPSSGYNIPNYSNGTYYYTVWAEKG